MCILLVDDSPIVQKLISAQLQEAGYEVEVASDGRQALELIDRSRPAVVLSDLKMPGMNGLELIDELERRALKLPVIVLSGEDRASERARAIEHGAIDYVAKTPDGRELLAAVQGVLSRA